MLTIKRPAPHAPRLEIQPRSCPWHEGIVVVYHREAMKSLLTAREATKDYGSRRARSEFGGQHWRCDDEVAIQAGSDEQLGGGGEHRLCPLIRASDRKGLHLHAGVFCVGCAVVGTKLMAWEPSPIIQPEPLPP